MQLSIKNQKLSDFKILLIILFHNNHMKNKLSERLKELRLEKNLSQKELSLKLGCGRTAVFEWESNGHEPNFDTLIKIADFFQVTIDYLLGYVEI